MAQTIKSKYHNDDKVENVDSESFIFSEILINSPKACLRKNQILGSRLYRKR